MTPRGLIATLAAFLAAASQVQAVQETYKFSQPNFSCNYVSVADYTGPAGTTWTFTPDSSIDYNADQFACAGHIYKKDPSAAGANWAIGYIKSVAHPASIRIPAYRQTDGTYYGCVERAEEPNIDYPKQWINCRWLETNE